jgi:sugar phosphate isomerase/epimerase
LQTSHEQGVEFLKPLRHFIFKPLGEGSSIFPAVIWALRRHRYQGLLVIEEDTTPENPTAIAWKNRLCCQEVNHVQKFLLHAGRKRITLSLKYE